MPVRVADLPEHERPRERLMRRGVEALSERELLALVLRHGRPGESALDLAATLMARFGGLAGLSTAQPEELAAIPGVGAAKAAAVVAALRLGRLTEPVDDRPVLQSAEDVAEAARAELSGLRRERVIVLVCDSANRLRHIVRVAEGAADRSLFPIREILNAVLRHDGRAFAVAHNHPSGDPTASDRDLRASDELRRSALTIGIRFLDHIIVAQGTWSIATTSQ